MGSQENKTLFQETFDIIFQNSLDMIFLVKSDGDIIDANIQACRYFGITLEEIKVENISKFIKEKKQLKDFLDRTQKSGTELERFTFIIRDKDEITFHLSSTFIEGGEDSFIVLICRDIQEMINSALQRQFFFELFQHDLLNKLHAEIGYIDFFQRLFNIEKIEKETGIQMLEKMRDITVKAIYLIQNTNLSLLLEEDKHLVHQKLEDALNHAIRYLKNFFANRVKVVINKSENLLIAGDEYFFRVFVNLIVRMLEYTEENIVVDITIDSPVYDTTRVKLHFEGIMLSDEEKKEILQSKDFDRRKLDIAVLQTMLKKYQVRLKIEDDKRLGEIMGTRMILTMPIIPHSDIEESKD
ncbi:MAG: PAS domain S-box protein [Candidatus Heimdallarchaeaceae archaeon]|jgi:PAS domain S-box-containing protein